MRCEMNTGSQKESQRMSSNLERIPPRFFLLRTVGKGTIKRAMRKDFYSVQQSNLPYVYEHKGSKSEGVRLAVI